MTRLHLVRHGRPFIQPGRPPDDWGLHRDGYADLLALRDSGRLPADADWFTSAEPKAISTARVLHPGPVRVLPGLEEQHRAGVWFDDEADFRAAVAAAFGEPERPAIPGWEPLAAVTERLVPCVRRALDGSAGAVVLVGHATAWTLLVSTLTGRPPDLAAWAEARMPDLWTLDLEDRP